MGEGGEFIPVSNLERNFTVGKEVLKQEKINGIAEKAKQFDIFDDFETEQKRSDQLDEIVGFASGGVIPSYKELVDRSCDNHRDQTQVNETFDVLRRGLSLAINFDQRWQTSLNIGALGEILPGEDKNGVKSGAKYDNGGNSKLDLAEGILEVTITNPKIREVFRRGSEIIEKSDRSTVEGRRKAAREMESLNSQLENIKTEAKADGFESEWNEGRAYFDVATGTLYGEMGSKDGSVDKVDEAAILNSRLVETLDRTAQVLEKLTKPRDTPSAIDYDNLDMTELNARNLEIPDSPEDQRKLVRKLIEFIEAKQVWSDDSISSEINFLVQFRMSEKADQNIKDEIQFVLTLNDLYMATKGGNGKVGKEIGQYRKGSIDAIAEFFGADGGITPDFVDFFGFGGKEAKIKDFKVTDAWNLLQKAGLKYRSLIAEAVASGFYEGRYSGSVEDFQKLILLAKPFENPITEDQREYNVNFSKYGEVSYNYFWDGDAARKKVMMDFMVDKLMREQGISKSVAKRSLDLAERMFYATGEDQYLNGDFKGDATKAKRAKIGFFRKTEWQKNKKHGPMSTMRGVESCDISYFRMLANRGRFGNEGPKRVIGLEEPVLAEAIKSANMKDKYTYYLWGTLLTVNKFGLAAQCYMDRGFDLDKLIEPDSLATKYDAFAKTVLFVPNALNNMSESKFENTHKATAWYILGQLDNAITTNARLTLEDVQKLYFYLVAKKNVPIIESQKGSDGLTREVTTGYDSFITDGDWDKIVGYLNLYEKTRIKARLVKRFDGK